MQIIIWLILAPLAVVSLVAWLYRMPDHGPIPEMLRSRWNRIGGEYHRLQKGKLWEPGEQERYRGRLLEVTAHSIDRHIQVQRRATCVVTNHRIMLDDSRGRSIQILATEIRAVRAHRTHETSEGYSYWVVVDRVGSDVHEPEGDMRFICASQEQSRALASAIEDLQSVIDPA